MYVFEARESGPLAPSTPQNIHRNMLGQNIITRVIFELRKILPVGVPISSFFTP
jgi:hypothetical protein